MVSLKEICELLKKRGKEQFTCGRELLGGGGGGGAGGGGGGGGGTGMLWPQRPATENTNSSFLAVCSLLV